MFLWKEGLSATAPEVPGNGVKVHQRGETLARGVKFQLWRPLTEREIVFMPQTFVGCEHQHGAGRRTGQPLKQMERGCREEYGGGGQAAAIALQYFIP